MIIILNYMKIFNCLKKDWFELEIIQQELACPKTNQPTNNMELTSEIILDDKKWRPINLLSWNSCVMLVSSE